MYVRSCFINSCLENIMYECLIVLPQEEKEDARDVTKFFAIL